MKKTIILSAMAFCGMAVMAHAGVEVNPLANSKGQDYKVNANVSRQLVDTHDANARKGCLRPVFPNRSAYLKTV